MLLHVSLCSEPFATNFALERPFLGVASHVNLESRVACEHFETDLAGGLAPCCKHIFHEWMSHARKRHSELREGGWRATTELGKVGYGKW